MTQRRPVFRPNPGIGAYRLDHRFNTHIGWVKVDDPLTYLAHKGDRVQVNVAERGPIWVDAGRLVPHQSEGDQGS